MLSKTSAQNYDLLVFLWNVYAWIFNLSEFKDEVRGTLMVSVLCVLISQFVKEFYHCITRFQNQYDCWPDQFVLSFYNSSLEFPNFLFFQVITSKAKYIEYMNALWNKLNYMCVYVWILILWCASNSYWMHYSETGRSLHSRATGVTIKSFWDATQCRNCNSHCHYYAKSRRQLIICSQITVVLDVMHCGFLDRFPLSDGICLPSCMI